MDAARTWTKSLLEPAPDPRQIGSPAQRQRDLLAHVSSAHGELIRVQETMEQSAERLKNTAASLREQAAVAVKAGREDLARQSLNRRQVALTELEALNLRIEEVRTEEANLALAEQQIEARVQSIRTTEEIVQARTEAEKRIGLVLGQVSREVGSIDFALERARNTMHGLITDASAVDQLAGMLEATGDPLSELRRGEAKDSVEAELLALRQEQAIAPAGESPDA